MSRTQYLALGALALTLGCGGGSSGAPDGAVPELDGIAAARIAADGASLSLPIHHATVTYLKPVGGSKTTDPAGFTIQAQAQGPGLFIAVDPTTLTPPAQVGDVVDFTITAKTTVSMQPRAQAITGYARTATGADVGALVQDVSDAADLVASVDRYDARLIDLTATITGAFTSAGSGFVRAPLATAGVAADPNLQLRVPGTVADALDLASPCKLTLHRVVVGRFGAAAQIDPFAPGEVALAGCPAPTVIAAVPQSATTLRVLLSRMIDPASVKPTGAQFTFDHDLTATAATVSGRAITLTTSPQAVGTTYALAIAATVIDRAGAPVAAPASASFPGYELRAGGAISVHTKLGLPAPASAADPTAYLSVKSGYVVSYNSTRKIPNWVSWELTAGYLGSQSRSNDFRPDDTLPQSLPQAQLADYSGSGYDRGHMCPSGDRTLTADANSQTFYLSNMVPQAANNNQGPWEQLEADSRTLASAGKQLYVVSGGVIGATPRTVGAGVVVPDQTFKVIVVLDAPGQGPESVTTSTRVIAVLMPNDDALIAKSADWHNYRVTVDAIEALTGYDFLADVDPAVQAVVEARVDNQ